MLSHYAFEIRVVLYLQVESDLLTWREVFLVYRERGNMILWLAKALIQEYKVIIGLIVEDDCVHGVGAIISSNNGKAAAVWDR